MVKEIECIITGRVQMIMFRDFIQRNARMLGIAGTVQNLDNGSVRVIAQGEEEKLTELISLLRKGPALAKVESVETKWREPKEKFKDFEIIY